MNKISQNRAISKSCVITSSFRPEDKTVGNLNGQKISITVIKSSSESLKNDRLLKLIEKSTATMERLSCFED